VRRGNLGRRQLLKRLANDLHGAPQLLLGDDQWGSEPDDVSMCRFGLLSSYTNTLVNRAFKRLVPLGAGNVWLCKSLCLSAVTRLIVDKNDLVS